MKGIGTGIDEQRPSQGEYVGTPVCHIEEVELSVEELESVIAPKLASNHNETLVSDSE